MLDQLSSLADTKEGITSELVEFSLGLAPSAVVDTLLEAVAAHDVRTVAQTLAQTEADGVSPLVITEQLIYTVRKSIHDTPELLGLLDVLLDVSKSTQPSAKLLTVLGIAASLNKPVKVAALATPVLEVSATIEELADQATKKHPKAVVAPQPPVPSPALKPSAPVQKKSAEKPLEAAVAQAAEVVSDTPAIEGPLDWVALLEYTRQHYVALYSVLSKCGFETSDDTLTLYTANAFYKKKLDDTKYSTHLFESLKATGGYQLTVHTVPSRAPMKDSQAAAIADIMGGGVEVSPEAA